MSDARPVLVIGSGPAAVSAAWPLLQAGLHVQMIDPGLAASQPTPLDDANFQTWRMRDSQWRLLLGNDATLLRNASPKLRAPEFAHVFEGFRARMRIEAANFSAHGSLATGGLSGAWGSGVGAFTEEELSAYPITRRDLLPSYSAVAERIGISGSRDDDLAAWFGNDYPLQEPNPLLPPFDALYRRYRAQSASNSSARFRLGRPQQAVITQAHGDRRGCDLRAMCIYGCGRRAIYSAAYEIERLQEHPRFVYSRGWFVKRVVAHEGSHAVEAINVQSAASQVFRGSRVVLAAGTLASTKLALEGVGAFDIDVPLATTPVMAFALLPHNLKRVQGTRQYALGLLAFAMRLAGTSGDAEVFGGILSTSGLLPAELYGRLPLLRRSSRRISAWLWPRLLIGTCFFPGEFSNNTLRVRSDGSLSIAGAYREELTLASRDSIRGLRREFQKLGATLLPGSSGLSRPGEEMHYGSTLPMKARPGPYETDDEGRLAGTQGVHIVDGSVLTTLPAKSHTLTIMANADRIARRIAASLVSISRE